MDEVLAAHLQQAHGTQRCRECGMDQHATQELITLLRDDYPRLMGVLGALSDVYGNRMEAAG